MSANVPRSIPHGHRAAPYGSLTLALMVCSATLGGCEGRTDPRVKAAHDMVAGTIGGTILEVYRKTGLLPASIEEVRHVLGAPRGKFPELDDVLARLSIRRYVGGKEAPDCPNPDKLRLDGWPDGYDVERYCWLDLKSEVGRPSARDRTANYMSTVVTEAGALPADGFGQMMKRRQMYPPYGWRYPTNASETEEFKGWLKALLYPSSALLDGWGREYRFTVREGEEWFVFEMRSAGKDGKFGTGDDMARSRRFHKPEKTDGIKEGEKRGE